MLSTLTSPCMQERRAHWPAIENTGLTGRGECVKTPAYRNSSTQFQNSTQCACELDSECVGASVCVSFT